MAYQKKTYGPQMPKKMEKRSAFGKFTTPNGGNYLKGWRASKKYGFTTIVAFPKDATELKTKTGKIYIIMVCTVVNKDTMTKSTVSGFWYPQENKLRLPDFDMVGTLRGEGYTNGGARVTGSIVRPSKDRK